MEKHFIAMITEEESDSNLYYVDSDYSIQKIKNDKVAQTYDKETLEDAKQELESLIRVNEAIREIGIFELTTKQIVALKRAKLIIEDILALYENN